MKNKNNKTTFLTSIKGMFKNIFKMGRGHGKVVNLEEEEIETPTKVIIKNFFGNKFSIIGLILFISICSFAFVGSAINPVRVTYTEPVLRNVGPGTNYLDYPSELEKNGVTDIQSGVSFSVAIDKEGKLYSWGKDIEGSLEIPDEVEEAHIKQIAVGDRHVLALDKNGDVYSWGYNSFNQAEIPSEIKMTFRNEKIAKLYASETYSALITDKGNLKIWGAVLSSKLDIIPKEIQGHVVDLTTSTYNAIVLLDDGTVRCLGVTGNELGNVPEKLRDGSINIVSVNMSFRNCIALDDTGKIHVWGSTENGLMNLPKIDEKIIDTAAGKNSLFVLGESGKIYSWGAETLGEQAVSTMNNIDKIYANYFQMYAVDENGNVDAWGNTGFFMGTDELGRSMFTRLMYGGTVTLGVGVIAAVITTIIGLLIGMLAGFMGGWVDNLLMRIGETFMSIPFMPIVVTLSSLVATTMSSSDRMTLIMIILGLLSWPGLARLVRGQILIEREKDFVLAARALGVREKRIVISHILPNVISICIVNMTLNYASFMLTESGLSFLGFGVSKPQASWGNMLNTVVSSEVIENYWWRWILPALCVVIAALSINLIGTALSDAIDPKSNEK